MAFNHQQYNTEYVMNARDNQPPINDAAQKYGVRIVEADVADGETYWKVIGVHRPLGGYWFNFMLDLGGLVLGFLMLSVLLPIVLPYSETLGFQSVISSLFALTFTLFDLGVGSAVNRFVAEKSAVDPRASIRYVSFLFSIPYAARKT